MILLFSGGIDSYVAWHYLNKPKTVYFNLNTPYSFKEEKIIKKLIPSTSIEYVLNLASRQIGDHAYIPYRNLYLAMLASKYSDTIVIAGVKDDDVSDKNEKIFKEFSELLSKLENRPILVTSPFWDMTKEQVIAWYLQHHTSEKLLETISCYSDEFVNYCGKCPSCFRKWCALRVNEIVLPFHNRKLMEEYLMRAYDGHYIPERNELIIKLVKEYLCV